MAAICAKKDHCVSNALDSGAKTVQPQPAQESSPGSWRDIAETLALTLVIFLLIRSVVQNFRIDGVSMEPNFHDGQFLIINKLAYKLGTPSRGDVVVFRYPLDPTRDFIKRVIGLPGDVIEVRRGQVLVNGTPVHEPYPLLTSAYVRPPIAVGPDELYVLGDNRNNSSDSHSWGLLPMDLVIGKAWVSYWPPQDWAVISHRPLEVAP
jgi:signal peptidase I